MGKLKSEFKRRFNEFSVATKKKAGINFPALPVIIKLLVLIPSEVVPVETGRNDKSGPAKKSRTALQER